MMLEALRWAAGAGGRLTQRPPVLALVVGAVVARADRLPPPLVVAVPVDRAPQAVGEAHLRLPAEGADLLGAQRVAAVVAGAVGDVLDELLAGARELEDPLDDLDVRTLVGAADVVGLTRRPVLEHVADAAREVLDVEPVAHVHPVAVDRQL